ncbi:Protein of unknown function [Gryllus bimaculatus]|nr:Protein of unknown function [Gryllus bimaculatus]
MRCPPPPPPGPPPPPPPPPPRVQFGRRGRGRGRALPFYPRAPAGEGAPGGILAGPGRRPSLNPRRAPSLAFARGAHSPRTAAEPDDGSGGDGGGCGASHGDGSVGAEGEDKEGEGRGRPPGSPPAFSEVARVGCSRCQLAQMSNQQKNKCPSTSFNKLDLEDDSKIKSVRTCHRAGKSRPGAGVGMTGRRRGVPATAARSKGGPTEAVKGAEVDTVRRDPLGTGDGNDLMSLRQRCNHNRTPHTDHGSRHHMRRVLHLIVKTIPAIPATYSLSAQAFLPTITTKAVGHQTDTITSAASAFLVSATVERRAHSSMPSINGLIMKSPNDAGGVVEWSGVEWSESKEEERRTEEVGGEVGVGGRGGAGAEGRRRRTRRGGWVRGARKQRGCGEELNEEEKQNENDEEEENENMFDPVGNPWFNRNAGPGARAEARWQEEGADGRDWGEEKGRETLLQRTAFKMFHNEP